MSVGYCFTLLAGFGCSREVETSFRLVLGMASEELAPYAAVKLTGGMPGETDNPSGQGDRNVLAT